MLFAIAQRLVYGSAGTTALMVVLAILLGVSLPVVFNPVTYGIGGLLGLLAPKVR